MRGLGTQTQPGRFLTIILQSQGEQGGPKLQLPTENISSFPTSSPYILFFAALHVYHIGSAIL